MIWVLGFFFISRFHFSNKFLLFSFRMEEHPLSPFPVEICSPLFTLFSGFDCTRHINKYHTLRVSLALLVNVYHAIVFVYEVGRNSIPNPRILGYFSVRYRRVFLFIYFPSFPNFNFFNFYCLPYRPSPYHKG